MALEHDSMVTLSPTTISHLDSPHRRRISIIDHGHENLAFESPNRSRKVSSASDHVEMGPVRKKSMLHNANFTENTSLSGHSDTGKHLNGDTRSKKQSLTDSLHSKSKYSEVERSDDRSWWYGFFLKCRSKESHPAWQPPWWHKLCPYPFCPTYRQLSRIVALTLIGILAWCVLYSIVGHEAAPPKGRLFQLIILSIAAYFGGWLMSLTTLPALIGMLFTGMLLQNIQVVNIDDDFQPICKELRNAALVILLIRAGLDLDPQALRRLKFIVMRLGLVPWVIEAVIVMILSHYIMDISWDYAFLMASIIAAVSPAVVVPCLFRLRTRGYGVAKGIPTLIIAIAGIDDAVSVAIFGTVKSIMFSESSTLQLVLQGLVSIVGGIGFGVLWGLICYCIPERHDPFMVPLRVLLLLVGGLVAVFGGDFIGYGGAGPLGCVAAAFACLVCWTRQGWEIEDNPAATAFEIFWMIFEPILFGITGAEVKFNALDETVMAFAFGILSAGVLIRMFSTIILGVGCKLNNKEKTFTAIALMSKATVQAALGPVALGIEVPESEMEQHQLYSRKIRDVCICSIMLTAPIGAILITILGPRLLTKMKAPTVPEGWRRSHRPSIRDISIIDEEEERYVANATTNSIDPEKCTDS